MSAETAPGPFKRFGWCASAPGTKPDAHHHLCRVSFKSAMGVTWTCDCPGHLTDGDAA